MRHSTESLRGQIRKKGQQAQPQASELARFAMVFATLPAEDLRGAKVLQWYGLQWQVERVFKRLRSIAQLERLPSHDDRNAKTWLHGKLLVTH